MDYLSLVRFTGNCVGLACSFFPVARAASVSLFHEAKFLST